MSYIMVDIEADGPIPGDYSMVQIGAVVVSKNPDKTFFAELKPISDHFISEALAVSGLTREQTLQFEDAAIVMKKFEQWVQSVSKGRPIFISDNNGFDWMFVCWYFHHFLGRNPFGHSSQNLGSLYKGIVRDTAQNFKYLRQTKHTHNPLDDALGNAEALLAIYQRFDLKIDL